MPKTQWALDKNLSMGQKDDRTKVLFVCVGNACRSPMAEAIARVDASDVIEAFSAGLSPIGSVAGMTKQTLMKNGYWVEGLEPKSISPEIWEQADIVINLSGRAREEAFADCSNVEDWEIEDPFSSNLDIYQQVFEKIRLRVAKLARECRQKRVVERSLERRARARVCPPTPIFVNLNGTSAGIVFNITEDGLAFSATTALPDGPLHSMWLQFPGTQDWIEACGRIAWRSKSNQEAGVRFVGLTEAVRQYIGNWISAQAFSGELHDETGEISEAADLRFQLPGVPQTESVVPEFPARRRQRSDKSAAPFRPKRDSRSWGTFAALGLLIGTVSLTFEWVTMRPGSPGEIGSAVPQKAGGSTEAFQNLARPPLKAIPSGADPSAKIDAQTRSAERLIADWRERIPDVSVDEVDRLAHAGLRPSPSSAVKIPSRPANGALSPERATNEPAVAAVNVSSPVVARLQPLPVGSVPVTSAQPDAKIAPPVVSTPTLPTDALHVDFKETRSPTPPPKQQAIPANLIAAVAIVADPYPSLRIPDGGISKKQRQATSLQLGHLVSRVEPIYPEEARQQGIQGTVKLHAIIGRQGAVENLESVDGSPVLVAAAMSAVRKWRYTETLLAGQSVETEEDIAITFRLSNSTPPTD